MLPIPENYIGSPCEVKAMDNKPILAGSLTGIKPGEIQITNKLDQLPVVHCNTTVKISIYNNLLGFRVLVGKVYLSSQEFIRITDIQTETDYEKRNFFRVKVEIKTEARKEDEEGHPIWEEPPFPVIIKDLSLSGLYLTSPKKLKINDLISVTMNVHNTPMSFHCKVVRNLVTKYSLEEGHGCEFIENYGPKFDLLCKYLFDCQREQIHRAKTNQS